MMMIMMMIQ